MVRLWPCLALALASGVWAGAAPRAGQSAPPRRLSAPRAVYPPALKATKMEGVALVDFVVDESGRVTRVMPVAYTREEFRESAVEAVKGWKFAPAKRNGVPAKSRLQVPIAFSLDLPESPAPAFGSRLRKLQANLNRYFWGLACRGLGQPVRDGNYPDSARDLVWLSLTSGNDGKIAVAVLSPAHDADAERMRAEVQSGFRHDPPPGEFVDAVAYMGPVAVAFPSFGFMRAQAMKRTPSQAAAPAAN